jgi:LPS sulfotransferase NodH/MoaA/NifB/PqqE/SkfB family radical SAM enzyme
MWPERSYFICTTPRSGSTFLCDILTSTGVAGYPYEYFNEDDMPAWFETFGVSNFADYFQKTLEAGTTANGVFGVKLPRQQFDELARLVRQFPTYQDRNISLSEMMADLFPDLHYIWLTRRNKVRQAVSIARAIQSGIFHTHVEPRDATDRRAAFRYESIDFFAQALVMQDVAWQEYFTEAGVVPLTLVYEDFCQAPEEAVRRVVDYLDITGPFDWTLSEARTGKKLADSTSAMWARYYQKFKQAQLARIWKILKPGVDPVGRGLGERSSTEIELTRDKHRPNKAVDRVVPSEVEMERFTAPPPRFIGLEVTMRCNLQCPMCHPHAHTPHSEYVGKDMSLDVVDLLAPTLRTAREVWLSGDGEPLLLPNFADFVDRCHTYNPDIDVEFTSNGVLLSERKARMVIEKRVHLIEFSIDGTIQYGHVGGGADYDQVKENLRRLAHLKEEYGVEEPYISIAFVAMRDNLCELPDVIEFAREIGAEIRVQPLSPATEEQRSQNLFRHMDYARLMLDACESKAQQLGVQFGYNGMTGNMDQTPRDCRLPQTSLWVTYSGELCPCCGGLEIGRNIHEDSLSVEEIWNGPFMRRLRWELDTGNRNDICSRCPVVYNTIENHERAVPPHPLEQQVHSLVRLRRQETAQLEDRVRHLESHIEAVRRGRVMRVLRTMERLVGRG